MSLENIIIIGGGPAGLAAAIYNSRANLSPLLFAGSPPGGQLILTTEVENYPGFESILGPELIEKMRGHAQKFGTRIVDENVTGVDFSKRPFEAYASPVGVGKTHYARSIIITAGAKALWLGLSSETRLRGKGVSACATCDGFFFRNKIVGVVGGGDTAMEEALTLTKFASKVYIIHRRDAFRASKIMQQRVLEHPKIEVIWNTAVEEVLGENKVEGVKLEAVKTRQSSSKLVEMSSNSANSTNQLQQTSTNSTLKLDGLFIAIGHKPDTDLFKGKVALDSKGYIVTSAIEALEAVKTRQSSSKLVEMSSNSANSTNQLQQTSTNFNYEYPSMTSVPGVFAAGDCVDHRYRQAATAVGMGVAAALEVERYLELKG